VVMLVRFNTKKSIPDDPAVINPAEEGAVAVRRRPSLVVHEVFEVRVDVGLHRVFCALLRANLRIVGIFMRVAAIAHAIILLHPQSRIRPVLAIFADLRPIAVATSLFKLSMFTEPRTVAVATSCFAFVVLTHLRTQAVDTELFPDSMRAFMLSSIRFPISIFTVLVFTLVFNVMLSPASRATLLVFNVILSLVILQTLLVFNVILFPARRATILVFNVLLSPASLAKLLFRCSVIQLALHVRSHMIWHWF
jgi:hypothetical protein